MQLCPTLTKDYSSNVTPANKTIIRFVLFQFPHQSFGLNVKIPADSTVIHQDR